MCASAPFGYRLTTEPADLLRVKAKIDEIQINN